jgi:DNA-binding NarL/FixJ family response regulator
MKRSSTKSRKLDDLPLLLSRDLIVRLENLRSLYGKDTLAAALEEALDVLERGRNTRDSDAFADLPPRLQQVLRLISDGLSTKEIASHLKISKKTVEFHRRRLAKQLGIQPVAKLARFAVRAGAVPS